MLHYNPPRSDPCITALCLVRLYHDRLLSCKADLNKRTTLVQTPACCHNNTLTLEATQPAHSPHKSLPRALLSQAPPQKKTIPYRSLKASRSMGNYMTVAEGGKPRSQGSPPTPEPGSPTKARQPRPRRFGTTMARAACLVVLVALFAAAAVLIFTSHPHWWVLPPCQP